MQKLIKKLTPILVMEDDRSGIIPEITDSYKYEEKILMGSADVRNAYLADRQLIRTGILWRLF